VTTLLDLTLFLAGFCAGVTFVGLVVVFARLDSPPNTKETP